MKLGPIHPLRLVLAGLLWAPPLGAREAPWHAVPVNGGLEGALAAVGLPAEVEPWRALASLVRRLYGTPTDPESDRADPKPALLRRLRPEGPGRARDVLLVPLGRDTWDAAVFDRRVPDLERLRALLADRHAALLALGLLKLDESTLRFVDADRVLVRHLYQGRAALFACVAGAVRVRDDAVVIPGGATARQLWERELGAPVRPAGAFLERLLAADDGRLAWLYATLAWATPARRAFAIGLPEGPARREERFTALRRAFAREPAFWQSGASPRQLPDASSMLLGIGVTDRGGWAGGRGRSTWEALLDGRAHATRETPDPPDAAWLVERVGGLSPFVRRERWKRLRFAQRLLAARPEITRPELLAIGAGVARAPAVFLVLERMGLMGTDLPRRVDRDVERIQALSGRASLEAAVAEFEGGLVLLDRARAARALEAPQASSLVASLAGLPFGERGSALAYARWLRSTLLPALGGEGFAAEGGSEAAIAASLGGGALLRAEPEVAWEGSRYRLDLAGAARRRFREARRLQGGPSLDAVLELARRAESWSEDPEDSGRARALRAAAHAVASRRTSPAHEEEDELSSRLVEAVDRRDRQPVEAILDRLLAREMTALAYAASVPDPSLAPLAARHDLGLDLPGAAAGEAWRVPGLLWGTGYHARGGLLAVEAAFGQQALRRIDPLPPPGPPWLPAKEIEGLGLASALASPFAIPSRAGVEARAAVERGRARVAGLRGRAASPDERLALAEAAGLDALRSAALERLLAAGQDPLPVFSLADLARLGGAPEPPACDAWGAARVGLGEGLCLSARHLSWDALAGASGASVLAGQLDELSLHALVSLAELGLPPLLAPALEARTAREAADRARPADASDGFAVERALESIPRERVEDAVSSLLVADRLLSGLGQETAP